MDSISDANTAFFSCSNKAEEKRNFIARIQREDSAGLKNSIDFSHSGMEYYANLFGQDPTVQ